MVTRGITRMNHADRYEGQDKTALYNALLALKTCPHCRADLQPVALYDSVYGCNSGHPLETWYIPEAT